MPAGFKTSALIAFISSSMAYLMSMTLVPACLRTESPIAGWPLMLEISAISKWSKRTLPRSCSRTRLSPSRLTIRSARSSRLSKRPTVRRR